MLIVPEALSDDRMVEILSEVTGKKIKYVNISFNDARGGVKEIGIDDCLISTILELNGFLERNAFYRFLLQ
jgi:uncharacterized protein YbjT (DUF2867 family)